MKGKFYIVAAAAAVALLTAGTASAQFLGKEEN